MRVCPTARILSDLILFMYCELSSSSEPDRRWLLRKSAKPQNRSDCVSPPLTTHAPLWGKEKAGNAFSGKPAGQHQPPPLPWEAPGLHLGEKGGRIGVFRVYFQSWFNFRTPGDFKYNSSVVAFLTQTPTRAGSTRLILLIAALPVLTMVHGRTYVPNTCP